MNCLSIARKSVYTFMLIILWAAILSSPAAWAEKHIIGEKISGLTLLVPGPDSNQEQAAKYLGLPAGTEFTLENLECDLTLLEVIGVYCPQCYKQAPSFNKLFKRINRGKLKTRVKMFALAAGGTEKECSQLVKSGQYSFPVLSDPAYTAHKILKEPLTPYTLLISKDGEILYRHLGIVENIDDLYAKIKASLP